MKLDLHVHSFYSADSINSPKKIIEKAKELGIGVGITDHNSCKAWNELKKLGKKSTVLVVLGQEIMVSDSAGLFVGELSGLFLKKEIKSRNYLEAIGEIHKQGGIVVVPHPFDFLRANFKLLEKELKRIDAIESFNARCYLNSFNKKAERFAKRHALPEIAGSDAHFPEEIGRGITEVQAQTLEEAKEQIMKGNAKITGKKSSLLVHLQTQFVKIGLIKKP